MLKILIAILLMGASATSSPKPVFVQTQAITVGNTTSELTLTGRGVGSLTLPPYFFYAGKSISIDGAGIHSATGNPTIEIKIKLGSTVIMDTGANASGNSTNAAFKIEGLITCHADGGTATVWSQGLYTESGSGANIFGMANTVAATIDATVSQTINITAQWGTQAVGNTLTMTNLLIV